MLNSVTLLLKHCITEKKLNLYLDSYTSSGKIYCMLCVL